MLYEFVAAQAIEVQDKPSHPAMGRRVLVVVLPPVAVADLSIPWQEGCALREGFDLTSSCGKPAALELIQDCETQQETACVKKMSRNEVLLSASSRIESFQQLSTLLEKTSSFSGGGWGKTASATAQMIQHSASSDYSMSFLSLMFGLASEETIEHTQKLRLTSPAREKLKSDPREFLELYGSRFVSSILFGFEFGGAASLTAMSHTGSKSLEAFASFQSEGIFSGSASASFLSEYRKHETTLSLACNARFSGGRDVPIGPYQTPQDLVQAMGQWNQTRTISPVRVMMITNGWMVLEEVQQILSNATPEVLELFTTDNVASTALQRISKEYAELKYLQQSALVALDWPRVQHDRSLELRKELDGVRDQLDTRLTQMETFNEADFRTRESEIHQGDYSWFKARSFKDQLDALMRKLPECVEDAECRSETQLCAQESVCVEGEWETLWVRKSKTLANGRSSTDSHTFLTVAPAEHKDWKQPLESMKAKCVENAGCVAFCNNPDDWSFFYSITNQGEQNRGQHGQGWSCFVKPSHSWRPLQHSVTSYLANPPAAQPPQWKITLEAAKDLCKEKQCKAFCWNPADWTHLYPTKPGSTQHVGWYGKGWQCFERV